ncbi:hypothetical protein EYF80_040635 [Liparis tanakae]|uniref:Uncharacterized protein n=1 Tax=Liparis tanakae TaxID=230148 RepID=A0A4Z2G9H0_9TELE|nr:hypothetical protein EYF80_040635 [Liparis tanakae]
MTDGVSGGGVREALGTSPRTSKPRLGFGDVDLNAVRPLRDRVLSEGRRSLGGHEAPAGFVPLAVLKVQRALSHQTAAPLGGPLRQRGGPLLLLRTQNDALPLVALDLLQLVKLGSDVIDGKLEEVPESSQVLRCGSGHGAGVLRRQTAGLQKAN